MAMSIEVAIAETLRGRCDRRRGMGGRFDEKDKNCTVPLGCFEYYDCCQ